MHNDVAELMRQTETLPICRHITVQIPNMHGGISGI